MPVRFSFAAHAIDGWTFRKQSRVYTHMCTLFPKPICQIQTQSCANCQLSLVILLRHVHPWPLSLFFVRPLCTSSWLISCNDDTNPLLVALQLVSLAYIQGAIARVIYDQFSLLSRAETRL